MSRRWVKTSLVVLAFASTTCSEAVPTAVLRAELDRLPAPPSARLVRSRVSANAASVANAYDTTLSTTEVIRHYTRVMSSAGWQPCGDQPVRDWGRDRGDRMLIFIKGKLSGALFIAADPRVHGLKFDINIRGDRLYYRDPANCGGDG